MPQALEIIMFFRQGQPHAVDAVDHDAPGILGLSVGVLDHLQYGHAGPDQSGVAALEPGVGADRGNQSVRVIRDGYQVVAHKRPRRLPVITHQIMRGQLIQVEIHALTQLDAAQRDARLDFPVDQHLVFLDGGR